MTVIVWDGKTLAGDTQINYDDSASFCDTKVYKLKSVLYGHSGLSALRLPIKEWAESWIPGMNSNRPDFLYDLKPKDRSNFLIISDNVYEFCTMIPDPIVYSIDTRIAIGSGADVAMGAMYAGADAEEAAKIACKLRNSCGGDVTSVKL